jgi:Co/Zn/Cd efflux system component
VKIKDLHFWALVPQKVLMAVKIRTDGETYSRNAIKELKNLLKEKYGFHDIYIEIYEKRL